MADQTVERNAELAKEVSLLKSRNKTLGNIVDVEKDVLIKSKAQASAMSDLTDNVKSIGNNLLSGAESMTSGIFGGALGGVLNSLTVGMVKRRLDNAKIEKEKAKEIEKQTAEEKALNEKRLTALVETLALSEEEAENGKKYNEMKDSEILEIIKNTELEKEKRERNEKIKEEEQKALDFIQSENKAKKNGGTTVEPIKENDGISIKDDGGVPPIWVNHLASIAESTESLDDKEEDAETKRERLRAEREAKGLGGQVVKLEGAEDTSGFSLMDIFKKGGREKLVGSLATGLTGIGSFAFSSEGGLFKAMKGVQFGKMAGFGLLTAGLVSLAVGGLQGLAKSKEWGVGDAEAALGGALGGVDKGVSGALGQAAKFGAIGAALGSIFPVIGTVIGGIIGALLGAFLGFFGGEKIAKAIAKMNSFLGDKWKSIKVAMGIDTYSDEEIAQNLEKEKKDLDNKIKQVQKNPSLYGIGLLDQLQSERAGLDAPTALTTRTAAAAQTRRGNVAIKKQLDEGNMMGGFYGMKGLFDLIPAMRGMLDPELAKEVYGEGNLARGGFIVNQPSYLPGSGVVVGEHGTYSGRGLAYGGIADGGPEAVIPLSSPRAGAFIDPMARSVSGVVMNQLAMARLGGGAGGGSPTVVTGNDMSSNQVDNRTTVINNPSPIGPTLPNEGRDFVSKVA